MDSHEDGHNSAEQYLQSQSPVIVVSQGCQDADEGPGCAPRQPPHQPPPRPRPAAAGLGGAAADLARGVGHQQRRGQRREERQGPEAGVECEDDGGGRGPGGHGGEGEGRGDEDGQDGGRAALVVAVHAEHGGGQGEQHGGQVHQVCRGGGGQLLAIYYLLLTLLHKHGELVDVEDVVLQEHPLYQDVDSCEDQDDEDCVEARHWHWSPTVQEEGHGPGHGAAQLHHDRHVLQKTTFPQLAPTFEDVVQIVEMPEKINSYCG